MNNLDGKKIEVKELFNRDFFYRIPEYQRPFSWEEDNFIDLIDDLIEAEKEQEYFLGTLVLHKKDGIFDVVDGQQRLTTLMILFACLRDIIDNIDLKSSIQEKIVQKGNKLDGIPERVRIEVKDREIFNKLVVKAEGTEKKLDETSLPEPQWRYIRAIGVFREKLSTFSQPELEKLAMFLSQKCMMIFLSTTTFDDAFKLFTIVNDRGKQLRRIDILKAKNIAPDIIKSESIRNSIAQKWEDWEKTLGENIFENVMYLIRFIILTDKLHSDLLNEYEERIFKKGLLKKGEDFIDTVCKYCKLYNDIFEDFTFFDDIDDKNKAIGLLYIMNDQFSASEWKAPILSYAYKYGIENIFNFIKKIEMKYLEGWVQGMRKDDRTSIYGDILKEIANTKNSEILLKSEKLNYDIDIIKKSATEDLYNKGYCKYMLLRLELLTTEHDVEKKYKAKSIEHVLPQHPLSDSEWKKNFDDDNHKKWINKIANLVLLSRGKNSSASNLEFSEKKKKYFSNRITDYPRSIEILNVEQWNVDILEERQKKAISLLTRDI